MNYIDSFNIDGVEVKQIPCIVGEGEPTESTVGATGGLLYLDKLSQAIYICQVMLDSTTLDDIYIWEKLHNFSISIDQDGSDATLIFSLGNEVCVVPFQTGVDVKDGEDGLGISSTLINEFGELEIEFTDGTSVNLGTIVGKDGQDGKDGINGQDGKDGISITKTEINTNDELVIYYSNNKSENLGVVVGADGQNGKDGINGQDGADGIGIQSIVQTTTSTEDGGDNVFTITLTNGETTSFTVKNGSSGSGSSSGGRNIQSDWNQTDVNADDYIKNKPEVVTRENVAQMVEDVFNNSNGEGTIDAGSIAEQ